MPEATAPGKLVLSGEYAVLEGAPAIATAVDVRARAVVSDTNDFERNALVEAVIGTIREKYPERSVADLSVTVNTDDFFVDGTGGDRVKLGLGSSAAALVALAGALMSSVSGPVDDATMLDLCCVAHRKFQGGHGSGIDVATAILGGVTGARPATGGVPSTSTLDWPRGLLMLPVWSGHSASTPELIDRFHGFRRRASSTFDMHVAQLKRLAEAVYAAWSTGKPAAEIIAILGTYDEALRAMDDDAQIGIRTDSHEFLRRLSVGHGAVYKTSGAGGGDFGIAFSESRDAIDKLHAEVVDAGFSVLDSGTGAKGLTIVD